MKISLNENQALSLIEKLGPPEPAMTALILTATFIRTDVPKLVQHSYHFESPETAIEFENEITTIFNANGQSYFCTDYTFGGETPKKFETGTWVLNVTIVPAKAEGSDFACKTPMACGESG